MREKAALPCSMNGQAEGRVPSSIKMQRSWIFLLQPASMNQTVALSVFLAGHSTLLANHNKAARRLG